MHLKSVVSCTIYTHIWEGNVWHIGWGWWS